MLSTFFILSCGSKKRKIPLKAIVIGIDGMDPKIVDTLLFKGLLPNFKKLKETGTYSELKTTNPAESPVAWASFITGNNPGKTNLFGFLNRNPNSYIPEYAPTQIKDGTSIFGVIPLEKPAYINNRKGVEVWQIISDSEKKEFCAILFCPEVFPPEKNNSNIIAGMEVPDIRNTTGSFTFYTTDTINYLPTDNLIYLRTNDNNEYESNITGPSNWMNEDNEEIKIRLNLMRDEDNLLIKIGDKTVKLKEGEWSDWIKMDFPLSSFYSVSGIGKFYLNSLYPEISLYLSPVNIDPEDPVYKISEPENFSSKLADKHGLYSTLGWECDTWALNDGYLNEKAFLQNALDVFNERKKILIDIIKSGEYSLIINIVGELDRLQHMFWRYIDPENKLYESEVAPEIKNAIYDFYILLDDLVGELLNNIDKSTTLIIMSDHGFTSYRKNFNLNNWLVKNNFINLKDQEVISSNLFKPFFPKVNWYKSQAYSTGIGAIYLNREGRESAGIIKNDFQYESIRDSIIKKLSEFKDPETNQRVVKNVYKKEELYHGDYIDSAPDLIVGLYPGYRVSQISSLGGFEKNIVNDNMRKWSGDHASIDPSFVPGIFFINRKINIKSIPEIKDISPTLLDIFEIEIPENMDGKSLLN